MADGRRRRITSEMRATDQSYDGSRGTVDTGELAKHGVEDAWYGGTGWFSMRGRDKPRRFHMGAAACGDWGEGGGRAMMRMDVRARRQSLIYAKMGC